MAKVFLGLEFENGQMITEEFDDLTDLTPDEIKAALEDAPIVYVFESYQDDKYGLQPATHFDPIAIYKR